MADDIKIKLAVSSTVKQDMDRAVADVISAKQKIEAASSSFSLGDLMERGRGGAKAFQQEEIVKGIRESSEGVKRQFQKDSADYAKMFGGAGNKAGGMFARELKQTIEGGGIMESLRRMASGDVIGAFSSLGQKIAMIGASFKAQIGIFASAAAGWKIGTLLDESFGISQKIADVWAGKVKNNIDASTKALREYRQEQEAVKKESEFQAERQGIVREREAIGGGVEGKLAIETERMLALQLKINEEGISQEEQRKRILDYEKQINVVKEAGLDVDEKDLQAKQKEIDRLEKLQKLADDMADDAEREKKKIQADSEKFMEWVDKENQDAEKKKLEGERKGIKEGLDAEKKRFDDRKEKLEKLIDLGKEAEKKADLAMNPGDWRNAQDAEKDKKRFEDRQAKAIERAKAMQEAGTVLPKRLQDLLNQAGIEAKGKDADNEAKALDAQWKKKQIEGADAMVKLEAKIDKLLVIGK